MGSIFYMFWMLVGGAVALTLVLGAAASLVVLIIAIRNKRRRAQKISAVCLALTLGAGAFFIYLFILDPNPRNIFVQTFHQPVPANVQNLKCHTLWIGDTQVLWLRFETDEAEFQKLLPKELQEKTDTAGQTGGPNAPNWWRLDTAKHAVIYHLSRSPGKNFGSEETVMAYDRSEHCVYFYFCGVD